MLYQAKYWSPIIMLLCLDMLAPQVLLPKLAIPWKCYSFLEFDSGPSVTVIEFCGICSQGWCSTDLLDSESSGEDYLIFLSFLADFVVEIEESLNRKKLTVIHQGEVDGWSEGDLDFWSSGSHRDWVASQNFKTCCAWRIEEWFLFAFFWSQEHQCIS